MIENRGFPKEAQFHVNQFVKLIYTMNPILEHRKFSRCFKKIQSENVIPYEFGNSTFAKKKI